MVTGIKQQLTALGISALKPGEWANDAKPHGAGQLQARKLSTGDVAYYYRYTESGRKQVRIPLGTGLSLVEARRQAAELSRRYQAGDRDLRAVLEAEQREAERQRVASEEALAAKAIRDKATLSALLVAYVEQLRRDGKVSAGKVERSLDQHVKQAWPALWSTPAADVTTDDLFAVVAKLADADKLREAAKLRSYLTAAYTTGVRARQDVRSLPALRELGIKANPARDIVPVEGANNARERALSIAELRAYWQRIVALPDPDGALLRFHLLTGAQRVEQLARATMKDVDHDGDTLQLLDTKGRRRKPRSHVVPLIEVAKDALRAMQGGTHGEFAFTADGGYTGAGYYVVQHRVRNVAAAMVEAGEASEPFTPGDLRRTVETRLAAVGVSKDVRAHLQSHGLGGVQDRHYDRHDRLPEKRTALETLYTLVATAPATVTPIKRAKARAASGKSR